MTGVGHLKRVCQDAFSVAGAVQETCSSEMLGGQGADFLRGVAFWSIRSSGLLRWFCVTGAALCMTWHHFCVAGAALYTDGVEKLQNAMLRGRQLCTQLSIFERSLAELLSFWCCQLRKLKESLAELLSFWCCQLRKLKESLAELLSFWCCQHYATLHYTTLRYTSYTTLQLQLQLQLHYTTLITLHYTTLRYTN